LTGELAGRRVRAVLAVIVGSQWRYLKLLSL
jgi:hypothetical protein